MQLEGKGPPFVSSIVQLFSSIPHLICQGIEIIMELNHEIDLFDCVPSESEHQTEDNFTTLPINLKNAAGTHLEQLNEDCLLEIFSSSSLTPMDLCSLAETCTRFKQATQRMFPKGFSIKSSWDFCSKRNAFKSKNHSQDNCTLQELERILKNFGPHLSTLDVYEDLAVVQLVAKYCDDDTLKGFRIKFCDGLERVTSQLRSIFQRNSLIELKIINSTDSKVVLMNTFPHLEQFTFCVEGIEDEVCGILLDFISRHGQLKSINTTLSTVCSKRLLHVIDSSCKKLEKLKFDLAISPDDRLDVLNMETLENLKSLRFNFGNQNSPFQYLQLFQALKSLVQLKLGYMDEPGLQVFDYLSQLLSLRELHLEFCYLNRIPWAMLNQLRKLGVVVPKKKFNSADFVNIVKRLINLEELDCDIAPAWLDERDFFEIIKLVAKREHVLTLKCNFKFNYSDNENKRKVKLIKSRP